MKALYIALSLFASSVAATAQNLITNPSFEDKLFCPSGYLYQNCYDQICVGWGQATNGSPDYFYDCPGSGMIPTNNNVGVQEPVGGGKGYVGIIMFNDMNEYMYEYVSTDLETPLEPGAKYAFSMHTSLADGCGHATEAPGVLFTTYGSPDSFAYYSRIDATPQVEFSHYGVIVDTLNWTIVTDTFIADSAYKHLVIGNFVDSIDMHMGTSGHVASVSYGSYNYAYYFIDSVSLVRIAPPTGVQQVSAVINVKIAPNPMREHARFSFDNPNGVAHSLVLYDIRGAVVRELDDIRGSSVTLDRNGLPEGFYYYKLSDKNGPVTNGSFLIN